MKRQFYIWHNRLGIVAFSAILIWSLSGFLHPLMSWTQPRPVQPFLKQTPIKAEHLKISLSDALAKNNLKTFGGFNIVNFDGATFYQILSENSEAKMFADSGADCHASVVSDAVSTETPVYLNTETGEQLENADERYAEYLARYFTDENWAEIASIRLLTSFEGDYKSINRLLPVYEVKFKRADEMRAFVETNSSKLGTLTDRRKTWLQRTFLNLHNFEFAGMPELTRKIIVTFLMLTVFLTALSGLIVYGLFWKVFGKQKRQTSRSFLRKYHRGIGIFVAVFLLAWSGSGTFHLLSKQNLGDSAKVSFSVSFRTDNLNYSLNNILQNETPVISASLIGLEKEMFYRIVKADRSILYFNARTAEKLKNGETEYAKYLAHKFSGFDNPLSVQTVTNFDGEYGFISKRLPVVKVQYAENSNERFYVETATGKLALRIKDGKSALEDYTFDYLHKGRWLDFAGRYVRDSFLMLMAFGNAIVAFLGLILFIFKRNKKLS